MRSVFHSQRTVAAVVYAARRSHERTVFAQAHRGRAYPQIRRDRRDRARTQRIRTVDYNAHEFRRLLFDSMGFYKLRAFAGHTRRTGARQRRRQYSRICDRYHQYRSAQIPIDIRAFSQPRTRQQPRLRYRFLRRPSRRGHRLRGTKIRQAERVADSYVRDYGYESGDQGRRQSVQRRVLRNEQDYQNRHDHRLRPPQCGQIHVI